MAHPLKRNRCHIAPSYNLGVGDHYNLNPAAVRERGYERTSLLYAEPRGIPQIPPLSSNSIDTSRDGVSILRSTGTRCNHRRGRGCSRSQRRTSATRRHRLRHATERSPPGWLRVLVRLLHSLVRIKPESALLLKPIWHVA